MSRVSNDGLLRFYDFLIEDIICWKRASFAVKSGPHKQAFIPAPRKKVPISRSPPMSWHIALTATSTSTGDGFGIRTTVEPAKVTKIPPEGSFVSGFQQSVPRSLNAHGSMIRALLRKRSGPTGAVQVFVMTSCHDAGMTHDMSPNEVLTTAARVGVDDEFGGTGALCGVWTAHAVRRNRMRTRARSLLPNRGFEIRTSITVLFN